MDICVAIGAGILGKISEYTVVPVGRQVGYLCCYTTNVDKLKNQVENLKDAKDDLQLRIDTARRKGEVIKTDVENWRIKAESTLGTIETFLNDEGHTQARSSLSLVSRHQLSRKAKKMTALIVTLVEDSKKFNTISYPPEIKSEIVRIKEYQDFETRKEVLKTVMEVLRDPNVRMVAVYGMGGVGKTVLAKEVMKQSEEENLFSGMVITTVSQTVNKGKIQDEIAYKLGLQFDDVKSESGRADKLRDRLKQEEKFLLVLDDIWNKIEIFDIGIHFEEYQTGCKILLTSRNQDVVRNYMDVENSFSLYRLSENEAEGLFRKIVGIKMEDPKFRDLAHQLVNECAGLPIALVTVAYALKNKSDKSIWANALRQLKSSNPENIEGMANEVYSSIRLSYDFLDSEAKSLLLLCSLYREDENIKMDDLVKCIACWNLFDNIQTVEEARNLVNSLVDTLKSRCLLLEGDDYETVKMHDIIRDVSIWIASKERNIYSLSDVSKLVNLLNERKLNDSKAISVLDIDHFGTLPQKLECTHIELLLMHCNDELDSATRTIPEHFFEETKRLKVLVFEGSSEITLPLSYFHFPVNLRSLCLHGIELEDVGLIGDLKNLNILDLSNTDIYWLPEEIGQLSYLQLLDLRGCENLKVIEPNVLSSLVRLEELYMAEEFDKWEVEGVKTKRRNASLIELKNLRELTTLYLCVADIQMFPNDSLFDDKLQRYQIHIGNNEYYRFYSSSLVFKDCERSQITAFGFQTLFRSLKRMSVIGLSKVKNNVFYDVDLEGFPELKKLKLHDCDDLQYVVNIACSPMFTKLESLHLQRLGNLASICHGSLKPDSFSQLREVTVKKCGKLKNLFPSSIATRLHRIEVEECETMKEIVGHDQREEEVVFNELRYLKLYSLPKLVQFMINRPKLGVTNVSSSPESFNYPLFGAKTIVFPSLKNVHLERLNITRLWEDRLSLANLKYLRLFECKNMKYVLSSSTVRTTLFQLERIEIESCEDLEEVVAITKEPAETKANVSLSFPKLQYLSLKNLPKLKQFCKGDGVEFPLLSELNINDCREMKVFNTDHHEEMKLVDYKQPFFSHKTIVFPSLGRVYLIGLNIMTLWEDQLSLANLKYLVVRQCKNLKYVLSSSNVRTTLFQLEGLWIDSCEDLEEVLAIIEEPAESNANVSLSFPKLQSLFLKNLPKLKQFCKGDSVDFPLLSELTICEMKVFIAYHLEEMKLVDYKQTLFSLKVAFPNRLCTIRTDSNEVINDLFGQSQFPCCNLKELDMNCTAKDEPISLSIFEMLHRYQNLEILKLKGCFVNAQTCSGNVLQSLSQPLMSFHNLTILKVSECNDLTYLLDSSTARGLSQLKEMWIWKCIQMKDIIIRDCKDCETTEEDDAFNFKRLENLVLYDLPNLESFFSENNAIMFLRLENLLVGKCPEMKSFSDGIITTFILRTIITEIQEDYDHWMGIDRLRGKAKRICWDGDVNTTIRTLWEESSNSLIQQSLTNTDVECSGEASSTKDN